MLVGLGMLGACSEGDDAKHRAAQNDNGTDLSLSLDGGNGVIKADGESGKLSIDLPGLKGAITMPKIELSGDKVDIDGVKLYPGSRVTGMDVNDDGGEGAGKVRIRFEADAPPTKVQRYFLDAFKDKGVTATAQGTGLSGVDEDGKSFSIDLAGAGTGTHGTIHMGPTKS